MKRIDSRALISKAQQDVEDRVGIGVVDIEEMSPFEVL